MLAAGRLDGHPLMAVSRIAFAVSPSLLDERDQWTGAIRYQVRATDHLDHGFHRVPPSTPDGRSLHPANLAGYPRFAASARSTRPQRWKLRGLPHVIFPRSASCVLTWRNSRRRAVARPVMITDAAGEGATAGVASFTFC